MWHPARQLYHSLFRSKLDRLRRYILAYELPYSFMFNAFHAKCEDKQLEAGCCRIDLQGASSVFIPTLPEPNPMKFNNVLWESCRKMCMTVLVLTVLVLAKIVDTHRLGRVNPCLQLPRETFSTGSIPVCGPHRSPSVLEF